MTCIYMYLSRSIHINNNLLKCIVSYSIDLYSIKKFSRWFTRCKILKIFKYDYIATDSRAIRI